jgi:hypothetical protein
MYIWGIRSEGAIYGFFIYTNAYTTQAIGNSCDLLSNLPTGQVGYHVA